MALRLEQKQDIVAEVNEAAGKALSAVLADYRGMTVAQMTEMRSEARKSGVYLKVIRNTLARRALKGTDYECLDPALVGPTLLALSQDDPGSAARLLKRYVSQVEALEVKALALSGQMYDGSELERISKLPTKDEAIALLMSVMQAPVVKLARTFNEVPGKLVRAVAAVRDQKQAAE